jgi:hypothetical protein
MTLISVTPIRNPRGRMPVTLFGEGARASDAPRPECPDLLMDVQARVRTDVLDTLPGGGCGWAFAV